MITFAYSNNLLSFSIVISLKSLMTNSTFSNFITSSADLPAIIPITLAPALYPDLTPLLVSSKTTHFLISTP